MNTEERALIDGLFDRLRQVADAPRDAEAEALIARRVQEAPHAPYALAQAVLVQDHALQAATARIEELQAQVGQLQARLDAAQADRAAPAPAQTSFLGGLFGGGRSTSVPPAGARGGFATAEPPASAGYPDRGAPMQAPAGLSRPGFGAGGGGGGGFLASAMTTAAGVAGGALLYDGIRSMIGGSGSPFGGAEAKAAPAAGDAAAGTESGSSWNPWGDATKTDAKDAASKDDAAKDDAATGTDTAANDDPDPFPYEDNVASADDASFADEDDDSGFDDGGDDDSWA